MTADKVEVGGIADFEAIQGWMEANQDWLTEWLSNVCSITKVEALGNNSIFQLFRVPLKYAPPHGIIIAGNELKYQLMMATVFGRAVMGTPMKGAKVDSSDPTSVKEWETQPQFAGFVQKVGRMPMEKDVVLYTTWRWFQLVVLPTPQGEHTFLETVCTVDHLPYKDNKVQ